MKQLTQESLNAYVHVALKIAAKALKPTGLGIRDMKNFLLPEAMSYFQANEEIISPMLDIAIGKCFDNKAKRRDKAIDEQSGESKT